MTIPPGPLAALASFRAAGARAAEAVAGGHHCVVLLGEAAETDALLHHATAALARGRAALHSVAPELFSATDLVRPGEDGILVVAGADRLAPRALQAIDAHLRREPLAAPRARLLLAASAALRDRTAFPDLAMLHRAALLVAPPLLPVAEQAALLAACLPALDARGRAALARASGGDPALLLALAARGGPGRALLRVSSARPLARALAHPVPLAGLAGLVLVAALLLSLIPPARRMAAAPPPTPALQAAAPPPAAQGNLAVETSDPGAAEPDDGVMVEHENPEQAATESAARMPRLVAARPGEQLADMYARVYRGLRAPPSFAAVEAVNPFPPGPGSRLVFPAPRGGWPRP